MRADQVQPYGNYVFIQAEKRPERVGLIDLPMETGIEIVGYSVARVVRAGPGRFEERPVANLTEGCWPKPIQVLEPGDRVVIRDYHRHVHRIEVEDEGEYSVIHFMDLLGTIPEGVAVGAWSAYLKRGTA